MPIALDNSATAGITNGTAPSPSFTVGAGSNRILFVGLAFYGTGDIASAPTYNGVTMTLVTKINRSDANNGQQTIYLWYLANPASGANTLAFSWSGSVFYGYGIASYSGA